MTDELKITGKLEAEDVIVITDALGNEALKISSAGCYIYGEPVQVGEAAEHQRVYDTLKCIMLGINPVPVVIPQQCHVSDTVQHGFDAMIEACNIFKKYANPYAPTHCTHDTLMISPDIDPKKVSEEDKARLKELGFFVGTEWPDNFISFRFGSA